MKKERLVIGTRGSKLALVQAKMVKDKIIQFFPQYDITFKIIKTKGDKILDSSLSKSGDKGLFVKEIDQALITGTIDIAVHSLKDIPTGIPIQLVIGGVLERGEVRDVLISRQGKKLCDLPAGIKVATSSLRRKAQLSACRKDIKIIDIRGNIDTRLKKMEDFYCDAVVLAGAGIIRLGYKEKITEYIDPDVIVPAVSQGIIGIVVKKNNKRLLKILNTISCKKTMMAALSERTFLHTLQGGCQVPIGCLTFITDDSYRIRGFLSNVDGSVMIKKELNGTKDQCHTIAQKLAEQILANGGREILAEIKKGINNE